MLIPRSVSQHRPAVRDDQSSQYDTNDWFSIENESLLLCSLAVISLRIPWALVSNKTFCEFLQDFDLTGFNGFIEWIAIKRPGATGEKGTFLIKITPPYPSNEGKVSASGQSIKSWDFETVISNAEPVTIEELYEALHSLFILFCPIG
jgi:hypothetical protein